MFEDAIGSIPVRPDPEVTNRYQIGDTIDGRFIVQCKLGWGAMGTVFKVGDRIEKKFRALKYCNETGEESKRFEREVRIMQQVNHKHVVPVLYANLDHIPPYFVMPLASSCLSDEIVTLEADEVATLSAFRAVHARLAHDLKAA